MPFPSIISPAIPTSIYSNKATFQTQRDNNGAPIANTYSLQIRVNGESVWETYNFASSTQYVFSEQLLPATTYDVRWVLTGSLDNGIIDDEEDEVISDTIQFKTRHLERFNLRPPIPPYVLSGEDFTWALQNEIDELNNYINTIDDERSIERWKKEGVGKILDVPESCALSTNLLGNELYMMNGMFQSGSGLTSDDPRYFYGARVFNINASEGYITLTEEQSPPLAVEGIYHGYMGAYREESGEITYDFLWEKSDTYETNREDRRWYIGEVTVAGNAYTNIDLENAEIVYTNAFLKQLLDEKTAGLDNLSGGRVQLDAELEIDELIHNSEFTELFPPITFEVTKVHSLVAISLQSSGTFIPDETSSSSSSSSSSSLNVATHPYVIVTIDGTLRKLISGSKDGTSIFEQFSTLYLPALSKGVHNITIQYYNSKTGKLEFPTTTIAPYGLKLQIIEFGLSSISSGAAGGIKDAKDLPFDLSTSNKSMYTQHIDDVTRLESMISSLLNNSDTNLSLEFIAGLLGRHGISIGEVNKSGLLRFEGSYVLENNEYGNKGALVDADKDGTEESQTPIFVENGNIEV